MDTFKFMCVVFVVIMLGIGFGHASDGEPEDHPTDTEPWITKASNESDLSVQESIEVAYRLNKLITQTNFIVGENTCSGTLISVEHKLVLTNHHCIEHYYRYVKREETADDGTVKTVRRVMYRDVPLTQRFYQGYENVGDTTLQSEIVARKKAYDLALLKIRSDDIPAETETSVLPDGEDIERGQDVWVVGNPRGLDASVTRGIISSVTRTFRVPWANNEKVPFIQTDAAINAGNSGGALYNVDGYLVGVPAAAIGMSSTLGLAIPYTLVQQFLTEECYEQVWNKDGESRDECLNNEDD